MTMTEMGLMEYLQSGESGCVIYDRMAAKTPEEQKAMKANIVNADYFIMSTNAITMDGELVNIDGTANRVSFLCYGPENVLVIAGMNKVATDVEDALKRVKNIASPPNAIRLHRDTPCAQNGRCADCLAEDCICSQTVVTRRSSNKGRIKVILVGEELGFYGKTVVYRRETKCGAGICPHPRSQCETGRRLSGVRRYGGDMVRGTSGDDELSGSL